MRYYLARSFDLRHWGCHDATEGVKSRTHYGSTQAQSVVLIAEAAQLKAKLMLKGRWRPEKMVRPKLPDGSGMLASVPQCRQGSRGVDAGPI